jgi:uncharacterized protein YdeI (YjbR/CyaY-like superfamily)
MNQSIVDIEFENRKDFRSWLESNHKNNNGIWIVFHKQSKSFSANDALEEAICFGWIDGVMKSIDEKSYKKYFSRRKDAKKWSDKNKRIFLDLDKQGLVTESGKAVFLPTTVNTSQIKDTSAFNCVTILENALQKENCDLLTKASPSRKKQLAGFYCDAKTDVTKKKRLTKIIESLETNYKGMLY